MGFSPYPGTFNIEIKDEDSLKSWNEVKRKEGIEIIPYESGFCTARCYRVIVGERIEGVVVIPDVLGYPDSKMEINCTLQYKGRVRD